MAVIAIDWDNTLVDSNQKLLPGVKNALEFLRERGHKIVVHSCNRPEWIKRCLDEWCIPVDYINGIDGPSGKPNCDLFIDDKGFHFPHNGSWDHFLIDAILSRIEDKDNRKW